LRFEPLARRLRVRNSRPRVTGAKRFAELGARKYRDGLEFKGR
jgi:hypothetical protein